MCPFTATWVIYRFHPPAAFHFMSELPHEQIAQTPVDSRPPPYLQYVQINKIKCFFKMICWCLLFPQYKYDSLFLHPGLGNDATVPTHLHQHLDFHWFYPDPVRQYWYVHN